MSSSSRRGSAARRLAMKSSRLRSVPPICPVALRYTIFKLSELIVGIGGRRLSGLRRGRVTGIGRPFLFDPALEIGVVLLHRAISGIERDRLRESLFSLGVMISAFLGTTEIEPGARRRVGVRGLLQDECGAVVLLMVEVEIT